MRRFVSSISAGIILCSLAALAMAAAPHLVGQPTTTDNGSTLTIAGSVMDLSLQDTKIEIVANGIANVTCTNPGGNEPAGQNKPQPVKVTAKGEQTVLVSELVNGVAAFSFTTREPVFASAKEAGCPNDHWTAETQDVVFKNALLRVSQNGHTIIKRNIKL